VEDPDNIIRIFSYMNICIQADIAYPTLIGLIKFQSMRKTSCPAINFGLLHGLKFGFVCFRSVRF